MADSIADQIADAVIAKLKAAGLLAPATAAKPGKTAPPAEATPADTDDEPTGKPVRKGKAKPEPEPEDEDDEDDEDEEEETTDLVTEEAREFVSETVADAEISDIRSELLDFYVAQGHDKDEISSTLADMDDDELRGEYGDYCARLVKIDDKGEMTFIDDFEEPYKAQRVNDGETALAWVRGGITLTDEEVKAEKLGDPNAKPEKKGPPAKRTKRPGK